jgi:hypothetical protein
MELGDEHMSITLFEEQPIRRAWYDSRWFYSVIDTIAVLTDSANPRKYWADMKRRITDEGFVQLAANCRQLKLQAPDGKIRYTDCADAETLLRIIQSIPSPKAEPFKQWLAQIGAEIIDDRTEDQRRLEYRERGKAVYKKLHGEIHQRGVRRAIDHAEFEDRGHRVFYGGESIHETEERRGISPGESADWMGSEEMIDNLFRATQTQAYIKRLDIRGKEPVFEAHEEVSQEVRDTIIRLGNTPPEDLPKAPKSITQAERDEERRRIKGMDLWPELPDPDA